MRRQIPTVPGRAGAIFDASRSLAHHLLDGRLERNNAGRLTFANLGQRRHRRIERSPFRRPGLDGTDVSAYDDALRHTVRP
jgi:hypothetical protein